MMLQELLHGASAKHRAAVARRIGLPKGATAAEIAASVLDAGRLEELVGELSQPARSFAARQVLGEDGPLYGGYYHSGDGETGAEELERCGLAFAFRVSWRTEYVLPGDVVAPLGRALATEHLQGRGAATAQRWVRLPLQRAHDAAAVWAALQREPARVKTDGEIYQRSWPKLLAALPAIDLDDLDDDLDDRRLIAALGLLREVGCLRLRLDSDNGWETKRELTATGELLELLSCEPDELRIRQHSGADCEPLELAALALLARLGPDVAISLSSFGRAAREFADEAARYPSIRSGTDAQVGAQAIAIIWLAGLAEIGVDADGCPCAVRLAIGQARADARSGPVAICQGNFELVVMTMPAPADRLRLELSCEGVPGQPHVYTITKRSAVVAERSGVHPGGALGILRELAGELPQNVERTVAGWVAGHGPPLRVRTAMMLDAADCATADRLAGGPLAGLVIERIGESLLAFPAARLDDVRHALASAGRELAPGLDEISGNWSDGRRVATEAQSAWESVAGGGDGPGGQLVSTLGQAALDPRAGGRTPASGVPARPLTLPGVSVDDEPEPSRVDEIRDESENGEDGEFGEAGEEGTPLNVILDAIEDETDVRITYAGADGVTRRTITPIEIKGAQVRALCHATADEHRFWIPSILVAVPAHD